MDAIALSTCVLISWLGHCFAFLCYVSPAALGYALAR